MDAGLFLPLADARLCAAGSALAVRATRLFATYQVACGAASKEPGRNTNRRKFVATVCCASERANRRRALPALQHSQHTASTLAQ